MRTHQGMSLIGLLLAVAIMLIMMWMFLSSASDELGPSSGMHDLLNWILP